LGLLVQLRHDRVGVGVDRLQDVADHVVDQRRGEEIVRVEVETASLRRALGGTAEQGACGVAEQLRHVHLLDGPASRPPAGAHAGVAGAAGVAERAAAAEEPREEVVEQAGSAAAERRPRSRLREMLGTEVQDLRRPAGDDPPDRPHGRAHVVDVTQLLLRASVCL
jgi:hypothetical protein